MAPEKGSYPCRRNTRLYCPGASGRTTGVCPACLAPLMKTSAPGGWVVMKMPLARCRYRMTTVVGAARHTRRSIVVLKVIDYVHACRRVAQEFQKFAMFCGTKLPGQRQRVADSLDFCASCKSLLGDGFLDAAFVLRGFRSERVVRFLWGGFFGSRICGFRIRAGL